MSDQAIAPLIEALNVTGDWDDQDHAMSALVLIKITNFEDGRVSLGFYTSDGMDWIETAGLLAAATAVLADAEITGHDPDDDD